MDTTTPAPDEHFRTTDGVEIRYRIAGHGPVLILHPPGWGIGPTPYIETINPLEDVFTIVYVWPRGSAGTSALPDDAQLDIPAFVSDLEALRTHLGAEQFALAGHSHSAMIALHYALQHPHRVSRLLLLSAELIGVPSHGLDPQPAIAAAEPPEVAEAMRYLADRGGLEAMFDLHSDAEATEFIGRLLPLYFTNPSAMAPLAHALEPLSLPVGTLQKVTATDENYPLPVDALHRLTVPAVIVAGRQDRFCPLGGARGLAKTMPHTELLIFEESGHFPWLEEPDTFFALVPDAMQHGGAATTSVSRGQEISAAATSAESTGV